MTDERADDPGELVAEARVWHRARDAGWVGGRFEQYARCLSCVARWPCLPARLADALEWQQTAIRDLIDRGTEAVIAENRKVVAARAEATALRLENERLRSAIQFSLDHAVDMHDDYKDRFMDAMIAPMEPRHAD